MRHLTTKAHDVFSMKLYPSLSVLHQLARPSRRPFALAYFEGMRFRAAAADWSEDRKVDWMLGRLRYSVRRAYDETAYYRNLFRRVGFDPWTDFSFDDYARLPVLERQDIVDAGAGLISRAVPAGLLRKDATGGSTGQPTELWLGPEEIGWRDSAADFFRQSIGAPAGSRTAFFWGHHLDPVANDSLRDRYYSFVTNVRWFDCFRLSPEVLERYHREFERWRPACIVAYASALGALAEYIEQKGYRPKYPSRCFITGGEKLLPHHRQAVESVFESPVYERYGSRDAGYIAFQKFPARDFEVDWSNIFVEPESGEASSSVLVTKLHADGFPMLRYRIGDLARFPEGARPGHPALALREVVGRDVDRIWLPDGRWIHGLEMPHLIKDYPVRAFNVVQRADYSIEVNIVPRNTFGDESRRRLLAIMSINFQGLPVKIEMVDEIPRTKANKWRPVISEVKLSQGRPA
ncbi:MAG TPA: hypothetical protein VE262_09670 [Blastocatellia bacterium]|nr:hypothetical protein [Blastocatellia bacterium]